MPQSHSTLTDSWIEYLEHIRQHLDAWATLLADPPRADISAPERDVLEAAVAQACAENPWFTRQSIAQAVSGLAHMLRPEAVQEWAGRYQNLPKRYTAKTVGIVAAGNLPLVAFHDILCTLIAGHRAEVKLSAQDRRLLPAVFKALEAAAGLRFELAWHEGRLPKVDAIVATGSNNTSRYFEYYFGGQPHIIRRNRNAVAILRAEEPTVHLEALGADIFNYFGLGCRNVAKLYVHNDFHIDRFFEAIYSYRDIVNHHKYANNYDYYKALWLMNGEDLLDNGFVLLRYSEALASPPGVLYVERYGDEQALRQKLQAQADEIQCIVSAQDVPFGKSQSPELWDYADGVDTMDFMLKL